MKTGRFYKTGDLGRYNADGTIIYLARRDTQLKIRGQRVDVGEVEHNICLHPSTKRSVGVVPSSGKLKERLVVLVTLHGIPELPASPECLVLIQDDDLKKLAANEVSSIRTIAERNLPRHMVPTLWIPVQSIPLLLSGKINWKLVVKLVENLTKEAYNDMISQTTQSAINKPSSEIGLYLQRLWGLILDIPATNIGVDQSFFSLGGDSVLAMQIISRCRADNVILSIQDIFRLKTIQKLAPRCESVGSKIQVTNGNGADIILQAIAEATLTSYQLTNYEIETIYPCSPMQDHILEIQMRKDPNAWYASFIIEVVPTHGSTIDIMVLAESWQNVVSRHQILRTIFTAPNDEGRRQQVVLKEFQALISQISTDSSEPSVIFDGFKQNIPGTEGPHHNFTVAKSS